MNKPTQKIGPYVIEEEIGRGGMGVVYRARDTRLDRDVAVKSLDGRMAPGPETLARFGREARTLAALNHPNVAAIHGLEEDAGVYFLILEYVDGETLAERLRRGRMPVSAAVEVCAQIAAGLEAAHEAGIVHRDLKPANVKIASDGRVKVLDFGLARMDERKPPSQPSAETLDLRQVDLATTAGTLLGTAPYMSPEQARGEAVDKRSDIWSFGVVLYECLTGVNPFAGPTVSDSIAAILTGEADLGLLPKDTPALIPLILRRSLQQDRRGRLNDAGDLRLLLEDSRDAKVSVSESGPGMPPIREKTFLIDDDVCRSLDREGFDPQLIGWKLQYADNERDSNILQVLVPSFGEDHSMGRWQDLLVASPYRTIVATPVGLEPNVSYRPRISMANQLAVLRRLVAAVSDQAKPDKVVVGGFS